MIYEGPFVRIVPDSGGQREIVTTVSSHQILDIPLAGFIWTGGEITPESVMDPANWYAGGAPGIDWARYTVEIAWEAKGSTAPLTGWQRQWTRSTRPNGEQNDMATESQMVNLKQKRTKARKDNPKPGPNHKPEPQYGGSLTLATNGNPGFFDPMDSVAGSVTLDLTNQRLWDGDWAKVELKESMGY